MKTTEKIRELKNSCSEWVMPTQEFINKSAQMAELLERAEDFAWSCKKRGDEEAHKWCDDFAKFQEQK